MAQDATVEDQEICQSISACFVGSIDGRPCDRAIENCGSCVEIDNELFVCLDIEREACYNMPSFPLYCTAPIANATQPEIEPPVSAKIIEPENADAEAKKLPAANSPKNRTSAPALRNAAPQNTADAGSFPIFIPIAGACAFALIAVVAVMYRRRTRATMRDRNIYEEAVRRDGSPNIDSFEPVAKNRVEQMYSGQHGQDLL